MTAVFASVAIGGTNCSVALAQSNGERFDWLGRRSFPTLESPIEVLDELVHRLACLLEESDGDELAGIGVVCGGPLDERAGLVLKPPNLPRWKAADPLSPFRTRFGVPVRLMNDANAGVLAEWAWGAAQGANDAVFVTMGTGLGAGLIVDGRLHRGASGLAGEIGHWRLAESGPRGHDKDGSFEGFCAGSGIANWAQQTALRRLQEGAPSELALDLSDLVDVSARKLGEAAAGGDTTAVELWADIGRRLGAGLSLLIDLLNPDVIVIGGIFPRQRDRLEKAMLEELGREAIAESLSACRVVPSALGDQIADYSGLAAALVGDDTTPAGRLLSGALPAPQSRRGVLAVADAGSSRGDADLSATQPQAIKHRGQQ
jgi:glucokinase